MGTPHWIAPEIILKQPYAEKVDIWSLGITLIELAKGDPPNGDVPAQRAMYMTQMNQPPISVLPRTQNPVVPNVVLKSTQRASPKTIKIS